MGEEDDYILIFADDHEKQVIEILRRNIYVLFD